MGLRREINIRTLDGGSEFFLIASCSTPKQEANSSEWFVTVRSAPKYATIHRMTARRDVIV